MKTPDKPIEWAMLALTKDMIQDGWSADYFGLLYTRLDGKLRRIRKQDDTWFRVSQNSGKKKDQHRWEYLGDGNDLQTAMDVATKEDES